MVELLVSILTTLEEISLNKDENGIVGRGNWNANIA